LKRRRPALDWKAVQRTIAAILSECLARREHYEEIARQQGTTFEGLVAASISGMLGEAIEGRLPSLQDK
jgi:hypothetical protein